MASTSSLPPVTENKLKTYFHGIQEPVSEGKELVQTDQTVTELTHTQPKADIAAWEHIKTSTMSYTAEQLIDGKHRNNKALAMHTIDWQFGLQIATIPQYPRIFQSPERENLQMVIAIIALFNAAMSVKERMDAISIYETARWYISTYTHDSVADLMLALRLAKEGKFGTNYNRLDALTIAEYVTKYMDLKYAELEAMRATQKATEGIFRNPLDAAIHNRPSRPLYNLSEEPVEVRLSKAIENFKKQNT